MSSENNAEELVKELWYRGFSAEAIKQYFLDVKNISDDMLDEVEQLIQKLGDASMDDNVSSETAGE